MGKPFLSPGDLPNPGIKPGSPAVWTDSLPFEPPGKFLLFTQFCFILFCFFSRGIKRTRKYTTEDLKDVLGGKE